MLLHGSEDSLPPPSPTLSRKRQYFVLAIYLLIAVGWPVLAILSGPNSPGELEALVESSRLSLYAGTGLILWAVFSLVWIGQKSAHRPLAEIGFTEPRLLDPIIGFVFLIVANIVLNGLGGAFHQLLGMETPDMTVRIILPEDTVERVGWILLSVSAGICEESIFRGFLLIRGQEYLKRRWPSLLISSIAFASGHLYQGHMGAVLIFVYGVMFCLLRYWRGSLWPGIWAHIWQDLGAMALGSSLS